MDVEEDDITLSKDRQDITLQVRSIEIDELNKWQPDENEKHIK